jgi:hypothetical protein
MPRKLFHACAVAVIALLAVSFVQSAYCDEPPPAHTNRLIDSNNPYLLLHAHNPVDWYPWGPEALERARRENKPIFLSIGYSTAIGATSRSAHCFPIQRSRG